MNSLSLASRLAVIVVALGALGGCVNRENQSRAEGVKEVVTDPRVKITTAEAQLENIPRTLNLTGSLRAGDDLTIAAKSAGRVVAVYVKEGDQVVPGQVLARQESTDATARLSQAQANARAARAQLDQAVTNARVNPSKTTAAIRGAEAQVRQAQANLNKLVAGSRQEERAQARAAVDVAKSELDTAKSAFDRAQRLYDQGAIARAQLEVEENRYRQAEARYRQALESLALIEDATRPEDIAAAREQVRQAEENLRSARANRELDATFQQAVDAARANVEASNEAIQIARNALEDLTIRASVAGRVSGKPASVGTMLSPGAALLRLVGVEGVYYQADVPEVDVVRLSVGMPVSVTVAALDSVGMSGRITAIDPAASDLGRLFSVRIDLTENLDRLRAGMFANGRVSLGEDTGVVTVPNGSIVNLAGKTYVFLIEDEKALQQEVTVVRVYEGRTIVEGVGAGAIVALDGTNNLLDGSAVSIDDGTSEEPPSETSDNPDSAVDGE